MFEHLKRFFGATPSSTDADDLPLEEFEDKPSFVWNEHMRIILAMVVVILSACVMWWILV